MEIDPLHRTSSTRHVFFCFEGICLRPNPSRRLPHTERSAQWHGIIPSQHAATWDEDWIFLAKLQLVKPFANVKKVFFVGLIRDWKKRSIQNLQWIWVQLHQPNFVGNKEHKNIQKSLFLPGSLFVSYYLLRVPDALVILLRKPWSSLIHPGIYRLNCWIHLWHINLFTKGSRNEPSFSCTN